MRKCAVVLSVGASAGGVKYAIETVLEQEKSAATDVYLIYGRPFQGQHASSPIQAVNDVCTSTRFADVRFHSAEVDPVSFDHCYSAISAVIKEVVGGGYEQVYLGITGGTNVMVATLFQIGMAELQGQVTPLYVQQSKADASIEFITSAHTRDSIIIGRVLTLCRQAQLPVAAFLAKDLPQVGRSGFVRDVVLAFAAWDDFRYDAAESFKKLQASAAYFTDDAELSAVLDSLQRYSKISPNLAELESVFSDQNEFKKRAVAPSWARQVSNRGYWLPIDALANAYRRYNEGRYSDTVMRAYRAVEIAVQCRLFGRGIHPAYPEWDKPPLVGCFVDWTTFPREISFETGMKVLEKLEARQFQSADRRALQDSRNHCYLEHGYRRIDRAQCESSLKRAKLLCAELLGTAVDVDNSLVSLQMKF